MKSAGFVRKIDALGRIVIPKEIRHKLNISDNCPLEISSESSNIVIRKTENICSICGSKSNLVNFKDKLFCNTCIDTLSKIKKH